MSSEVRHFRLINSEELIGNIISESKDDYIIQNPLIVIDLPDNISLQKYVPFSQNQSVAIKKMHIVTVTELHAEMIRYYHNSLTLARNSSIRAIDGLNQVNDTMEAYIYEGRMPTDMSQFDMSNELLNCPGSNTVH